MSLYPRHDDCLKELEDRLFAAETVAFELISDVVAIACERFNALGLGVHDKLDRLIAVGAWTDAALTLVELELPQWHLRHLINDGGEWLCTLSTQPGLPIEFDEVVEARHVLLPLAILSTLVQAKRATGGSAPAANSSSQDASWQTTFTETPPARREAALTAAVIILAALVLFCAGMLAPALWTALAGSTQFHPTSQNCGALEVAADRHACVDRLSERIHSHPAKGANAPFILRLSGQRND
jgi:hypothetical protein